MSSSLQPSLLYHDLSSPLYPTNIPGLSLLAIRLPHPVRVTSLRITPEGVLSTSGIGRTVPARWNGRLLLNVLGSEPINALSQTEISYEEAGWEQEYPIDMPEGVTTRLLILQTPATCITLSVYGYDPTSSPTVTTNVGSSKVNTRSEKVSLPPNGRFLDLLDDSSSRSKTTYALQVLEVLISSVESDKVLQEVIQHPTATDWLLSQPSYPPIPLLQHLLADPQYALHPKMRHYLPPSHPLRSLVNGTETNRRDNAWNRLDAAGLMILKEIGPGDIWEVQGEKSRYMLLLEKARSWAAEESKGVKRSLELALDILTLPTEREIFSLQAEQLAKLVVISRCRGSSRTLSLPTRHARNIVKSLLEISTQVISNTLAFPHCIALVKPYLSYLTLDDPLVTIWKHTHTRTSSPSSHGETPEERRLYRLSRSISSLESDALVHSVTTEEMMSLMTPCFLADLRMARVPPLGISSTTPAVNPGAGKESQIQTGSTSASAWAGKVYSSHQFRNRDLAPQGTMSRPASRHVDEYGVKG
ncbi:hypothetical protein TREMEDRAFT_73513 [Tremella mesenterica DSM 1558]|uniref:uncharacterized protein n=1 Tax=Tremella mesenterica (strain ATCC 24925 / CBS 8224 / DSM 1558 / NBRC 9311 / NRRL Y-6157 / RJB 2259-6 / UBC 559-6) TaxID=578456 RepID=UPI0003F4A3AB|nr:uncharacterized protein TREMEDRAFT_73513 [Tremella mesenterica DSM 1558]EIW70586.1 hypothetical protein TREMEDRAFT_73513 [Tremella mesenterica DSM 1558]